MNVSFVNVTNNNEEGMGGGGKNNSPPPENIIFLYFLSLFILPIWQTGCALLNTEKSKFVSCLTIST